MRSVRTVCIWKRAHVLDKMIYAGVPVVTCWNCSSRQQPSKQPNSVLKGDLRNAHHLQVTWLNIYDLVPRRATTASSSSLTSLQLLALTHTKTVSPSSSTTLSESINSAINILLEEWGCPTCVNYLSFNFYTQVKRKKS